MSNVYKIKLFFDECIGLPLTNALGKLLRFDHRCEVSVDHVIKRGGGRDEDWLPPLAEDPSWIVISADLGRKKRAQEKLPVICQRIGIRHILLASSLHNSKQFEKARAMLVVWPDIVSEVAASPTGSRFQIQKAGKAWKIVAKKTTEG